MIGETGADAAILSGGSLHIDLSWYEHEVPVPGVPAVSAEVVPPGWSPGEPLDPSQGSWSATLAADALTYASRTATLHVAVRNIGDRRQRTRGYFRLLVGNDYVEDKDVEAQSLPPAILEPGATQIFSIDVPVDPRGATHWWLRLYDPGVSVWGGGIWSNPRVTSNRATITPLPEASAPGSA